MPSVLGVRPALTDEPEETDNDLDDVSFGAVSGRSLLLPKSASETLATPHRAGAKAVSVPSKLSINRSGSPSSNDGYHSPSPGSSFLPSSAGPSRSSVAATVASLTRYGTETATAEGVILPSVPTTFGSRAAHVFARVAAHAPKELLIMRHSYRLFILGAFFQYVHSVAHNLAYFLHIPKQPLFDIGFAVLPAMSTPVQIVSEIAFFIIVVLTVLYALSPFYHDNLAAIQTTLLVGAAARTRSRTRRARRAAGSGGAQDRYQQVGISMRSRLPGAVSQAVGVAGSAPASAATPADAAAAAANGAVRERGLSDVEKGLVSTSSSSSSTSSAEATAAAAAAAAASTGSPAAGGFLPAGRVPESASLPAALSLSPNNHRKVTPAGSALTLTVPPATGPTVTAVPYHPSAQSHGHSYSHSHLTVSPALSTASGSASSSALTYNRAFAALLLETSRRGERGCPRSSALAASPTSSSAAVAAAAAASAARWDGYVTWAGAHPPTYTVNVLARFFAVLVMAQAVRITCFLVTALPGPNYHCHPFSPHYDPPTTFMEVLFRSDAFFSCGDLVFSSHTTFIVLCALTYQKYGRTGWLKVAFWAIVGVFGLLVISAHKHYSLDIVVALYTVPLIWYAYDIYCPDLVPEELVAWEVEQAKVLNPRIADVVG